MFSNLSHYGRCLFLATWKVSHIINGHFALQGAFFCRFPDISTTALAPIWTAPRKLRKLRKITATAKRRVEKNYSGEAAAERQGEKNYSGKAAAKQRWENYIDDVAKEQCWKNWRKLQRLNRYRTVNMGQKKCVHSEDNSIYAIFLQLKKISKYIRLFKNKKL